MIIQLIPLKALTSGTNTLSLFTKHKPASLIGIRQSIEEDGLLYPLVVVKSGSKYLVVDGKKRLSVIRNLARSKRYTRSMAKIPCIVRDANSLIPLNARRPVLLTAPELAQEIIKAAKRGLSYVSVAQRFDCDISVVEDCVSLTKLNPELLKHFNNKVISLEQAAAFATIDNKAAQLTLLHQLGPFVSDVQVIEAIRAGETVIEVSLDNVIVLPSRGRIKTSVDRSTRINEFGNQRHESPVNGNIAA